MAVAYVALGSNLNDPVEQVKNAIEAIKELPTTKIVKVSSLYQSEPVGYDDQPDFINAVVELQTKLPAEAFLSALFEVETAFGRVRPFPNAPRLLDLDLLLYDDIVRTSKFITVPHPRMHTRAFVMLPLAEIAPHLVLKEGGSVVELAQALQDQTIKKLSS